MTDPAGAAWEAAGLYDPTTDAPQRLAVLEYLAGLGLSVDDIRAAAGIRLLNEVAAEKVLWDDAGPTLTLDEVAARAGVSLDLARLVMRASGIPDPGDQVRFRDAHVAVFEAYAVGAAFFGEEAIVQFARTVAAAAARVTDAAISLFNLNVLPQLDQAGAEEVERVRTAADAVRAFNVLPPAMDVLLREQFVTSLRRFGMLDVGEGGAMTVAVAFVDLVSSTELANRVDAGSLTSALRSFEGAAYDLADTRDCRVVKLIGDEAMFVGPSAAGMCSLVLDLLSFVAADPVLGAARAGVAVGPTVPRDGDVFGPFVNLAARLVKEAEPGSALVSEAVARTVPARPVGTRELKGFDQPVEVYEVPGTLGDVAP